MSNTKVTLASVAAKFAATAQSESTTVSSSEGKKFIRTRGNCKVSLASIAAKAQSESTTVSSSEGKKFIRKDSSMIIVYHIETTGLSRLEDEILSLSIINGEGVVLFDELIKPRIKQEWWHAQAINGISPSSVKDKRTISEHLDTIQDLFDQADELIAYNPEFENAFLEEAGIIFPERATFNVMDEFAVRSAKWNKSHGSYTRQKLSTCAEYYGYKADIRTGLGKVKATLHCYQRQTANYLQP